MRCSRRLSVGRGWRLCRARRARAGLLTAYLVATALATVRPAAGLRWLNVGALLLALTVGLASLAFVFEALASGVGDRDGIPAPIFVKFAVVALLASGGDIRMLRSGGLRGPRRLVRHLWRMCFALYIATSSFFLGQADEFPEMLRHPALLALPVLAVLVAMVYWLWRVRIRGTFRNLVGARSNEVR